MDPYKIDATSILEENLTKISVVKVNHHDKIGTLRVLIPKEIRDELGIKSGDSLFVTYDKQKRLIYKKVESDFKV